MWAKCFFLLSCFLYFSSQIELRTCTDCIFCYFYKAKRVTRGWWDACWILIFDVKINTSIYRKKKSLQGMRKKSALINKDPNLCVFFLLFAKKHKTSSNFLINGNKYGTWAHVTYKILRTKNVNNEKLLLKVT